jgi:hypothetical protein
MQRKARMKYFGFLFAFFAIEAAMLSPARPTAARDADWPCVQPKVPQMSVAAMWDGPSIEDVGNAWQNDPKIKELVIRLAARRTPLDATEKAISGFITGSAAEKEEKAKKLFAGLFDSLSEQRSEIMSGIERVAGKQKELADKIRSDVAELHELEDKPQRDQSKINMLASQVEWSTRIFEDRRKTIRYVCEAPTVIEQRVFALGRTIRKALD